MAPSLKYLLVARQRIGAGTTDQIRSLGSNAGTVDSRPRVPNGASGLMRQRDRAVQRPRRLLVAIGIPLSITNGGTGHNAA